MAKHLVLLALIFVSLLTAGCDKLEDSDLTAETLAGRWAFSYKTSEPLDFELSYRFVVFHTDGTCALVYDGGQLNGTWRASEALIKIEGSLDDGRQQLMLWRVLSLSPYHIEADYDHEMSSGRNITITVTLDKL